MSICENAMVVNLQIGAWTGHRLDKAATDKVISDAHAHGDAARVNKHLIPKTAMKDITSAASAVRNHFYEKTLPWKDNGDRLLTRVMYMDFVGEHAKLTDDFRHAVDRFLRAGYPTAVEQAEFRMGKLFNADDYPSPEALRRKFYINLDIDAVVAAGDFRVEMDQDHIDSIKQDMEAAMEHRMAVAMRSVWERLADVVSKFHERMENKDAIFRNSLVENMREMVDLLPGLNVTNDPDITAMGDQIRHTLYGYEPDDLRANAETRFEAAEASKEIMDRMRGFMNAFNASEGE